MNLKEIKEIAKHNQELNGETLHVVQISGGKDSQAVAKLIRQKHKNERIVGLFCDTGFEHPITYHHISNISVIYDIELVTLKSGNVLQQIVKNKRYPSDIARFCTSNLKIKPAKKYLIEKAVEGYKVISYLGVRSNESTQRSKRYADIDDSLYLPHDFSTIWPQYMGNDLNIRYCAPIIDWSTTDVFEFLDGEHNILYDAGFERVGCFPCLASSNNWKKKAFTFDATGQSHFEEVSKLEKMVIEAGHYPLFYTKKKGEIIRLTIDDVEIAQDKDKFHGCSICAI